MASSSPDSNNTDPGIPLKLDTVYDDLFVSHLSPKARSIHRNRVLSTQFEFEGLPLQIQYYGRTVTGPVTERHIRDFAREINELAEQGWIEGGCLTALINLQLAAKFRNEAGNTLIPARLFAPTPAELAAYPLKIERTALLFYAGSRYSLAELRRRDYHLGNVPSVEGELPPPIEDSPFCQK
jgi:hypothetical protein